MALKLAHDSFSMTCGPKQRGEGQGTTEILPWTGGAPADLPNPHGSSSGATGAVAALAWHASPSALARRLCPSMRCPRDAAIALNDRLFMAASLPPHLQGRCPGLLQGRGATTHISEGEGS